MMLERRKLNRWQIDYPAKIKFKGAEVFIDCLLRDINFKGMQLVMGFKLSENSQIQFNLMLSERYLLKGEGWIVWRKKSSDFRYIYGVSFTHLSDSDKEKIYQFIYQTIPEAITKHWWKEEELEKKGGRDMEDRRIFQRFNIRFPVKLLDLQTGKEITGETHDICAKGLGVWAKEKVSTHTPLEVWLTIPDMKEPFYTRGNVVWVGSSDKEGDYRFGINLEKADLMSLTRILK